MFSLASSTVLALALASSATAAHSFSHLRRHHVPRAQPAGWVTGYLEVYDTYHTRYMAIDCDNKHNTSFFDSCCHPLLATETVEKNRPACCAVGATASCPGASAVLTASSSAVTPSATHAEVVVTSSSAVSHSATHAEVVVTSSSSAAAPATTSAADEDCDDEDDGDDDGDDGECDDEDTGDEDDEDCEDEQESSTVKAATSTHVAATTTVNKVATSTHAPAVVTPTTTTTATTKAEPTTTSTTPEPTTSTKAQETTTSTTPKPTTTPKATPTTTTTADTSTKTAASSGGSFTLGGFGTWFTQNGVAGACGTVHKDTDFVVALQTTMYANSANCGRKIRIINLQNNKSVDGVVADECPSCTNIQSVDMSVSMFEALAALTVGEFSIKWEFLD
ncbi:hypothetical protein B0H17DRAFT_1190999 [Mycena rosella]|uniref:Uncharacterized protein n=1 Tax=Mycena rosella TaxID=1033263 RepID=A0AAD7MBU2_MYCRO|nr:hypothetical protein B0H17DRAFT_1190999 [Mycena rosella]